MAGQDDKQVTPGATNTDEPQGLNSESRVEPGEVELLLEKPAPVEGEDSRITSNGDDEDDEVPAQAGPDNELAQAATEEEREAIRARRRQERRDRKQKQRDKMDGLEREVRALAEQNRRLQQDLVSVQNVTTGQQLAALDSEIVKAGNAVEHFKNIIADAATKGDGRVVAEATQHMINAQRHTEELRGVKAQALRAQQAPRPLDNRMVNQAQSFMSEHKWYGANSPDPDSRVLTALDNSLTAEGWDPTTPEYWTELRARGAKYLPHRFSNTQPQNTGNNGGTKGGSQRRNNGSPVTGGDHSSNNVGGSSQQGYHVSAERVKAMKDAGIWEDPKRRASMIERYKQQDRAAAGRN